MSEVLRETVRCFSVSLTLFPNLFLERPFASHPN
jgi:hypothetical protein